MAIPVPNDSFKRDMPPAGRHNSICVDVWDPGVYKANGGPSDSPDGMIEKRNSKTGAPERKHMVNLVFVLGDRNGNPLRHEETGWLMTVSQRFNNTLYETAHMPKFIAKWLLGPGKKLGDRHVAALKADLERPLLGKTGELQVVHNGDYANIDWVEPLPEGYVPMTIPEDYVRVQNRAAERQRRQQAEGSNQQQRQATPPPASAPQRATDNAFGEDDVFGAAPVQAPAKGYDDYKVPPLEDDDDGFVYPF